MLIDKYGRRITTLRLIITYKCNLSCFFCHHEGSPPEDDLLDVEDYEFIAKVGTGLGITKYKITGGEPLLRDDIVDIVRAISGVRGVKDISLTTNGTLLSKRLLEKLREAGLMRINISLHTLERDKYKLITGRDALDRVLKGIENALEVGFNSIKLNVVVLRGINDEEVWNIINYALKRNVTLQLIELQPAVPHVFNKYYVPISNLLLDSRKIRIRKIHVKDVQHRVVIETEEGAKIELVNPIENREFCKYCNRLRLTPGGRIKPCIFTKESINALSYIKNRNEEELRRAFIRVLKYRRPYFS